MHSIKSYRRCKLCEKNHAKRSDPNQCVATFYAVHAASLLRVVDFSVQGSARCAKSPNVCREEHTHLKNQTWLSKRGGSGIPCQVPKAELSSSRGGAYTIGA